MQDGARVSRFEGFTPDELAMISTGLALLSSEAVLGAFSGEPLREPLLTEAMLKIAVLLNEAAELVPDVNGVPEANIDALRWRLENLREGGA